jgi:PAS domain-containing protein
MTAERRSVPLEALRSRFAVVQTFRRGAEGIWEVSDISGAHSGAAPSPNAGLRALDYALSWIAEPCRGQVVEALESTVDGLLDRTLRCEGDPAAATERWFEISLSRLPDEDGQAVCLLTARDVTQEQLAVQQLAERSEHWALVSTATGLGSITYDIATRVVHLDELAAIHHCLGATESEGVALDVWVGCLVAEDRAKAHELLTSLREPGQTQALTVRLPGISAKQLKVLELSLIHI